MKRFVTSILICCAVTVYAQDIFLPPLNAKIIQYVNQQIGKKVDKGECWDLAYRALEFANANHPDTYVFGRKLEKNEEVYSGDIIQFENVQIKVPLEDGYMIQDIPHHTAVVYETLGKLHYRVADQNNAISGKKVSVHELNLNLIQKGKYTIFRPEEK